MELLNERGYPLEVYENVETEDNYLLTVHRIPPAKKATKPVVLLMHSLFGNSSSFLIPTPDKALATILNDNGYDVWLGNCRGTQTSRKHKELNSDADFTYWNFTVHEMAIYDVPAILKLVQNVTGCKTLSCIGHSQGALLFTILLSEKPEFNKCVNLVVLLAPVALGPNSQSIILTLPSVLSFLLKFLEVLGICQVPVLWSRIYNFYGYMRFGRNCQWYNNAPIAFFNQLAGKTDQLTFERYFPLIMKHFADTTSLVTVKHYLQLQRAGALCRFDYGRHKNSGYYGTPTPPHYDLGKVTSPVVVFCSRFDYLTNSRDIRIQYEKLPNCIAFHDMENPGFNHLDFLYGKDAFASVVQPILRYLSRAGKAPVAVQNLCR